jgi:hypothetical protein
MRRRRAARNDRTTQARDFLCRELAPHVHLLTYTLRQGERLSCRATIWPQAAGASNIVFHQGTAMQVP